MKKGLSLILLITVFCTCFAGNNPKPVTTESSGIAIVSGIVTDKITGEPLPGVLVTIRNVGMKVYTDLDGKFELHTLPAGSYSFSASYVSYTESPVKEIRLSAGQLTQISIQLSPVY